MSAKTGSGPFSPVDLSAERIDLRSEPIDLNPEDVRFLSWEPWARKRPRAFARFSIAFCTGAAGTLLWQSYGDAAIQMIANLYPQLGWVTPRDAATVEKAPDTIAPTASDAPHPDQRQLDAALGDLHAMRLSLERIVAGQELIARSIDEIATGIAAGQEQMTHSTDPTATSVVAEQQPTTRSANQSAATITTGQGQMKRNTDQTTTSVDQARSAKASSITVESRDGAASLQPTVPLNIKPTEAKPPQTSSERGKQLPAASGHDASCFPSASAVLKNHPGGWATWTLRAPGHEGTLCWHAAARPSGSDHRRETRPGKEIGTTENGLSAPSAPYGRGGSWEGGLP